LNQLVNLYEIQYGGHATEGDLNAIIVNAVATSFKMVDVQTAVMDAKLAPVNVGP
jgi:hypothetical protein